MQRRCSMSPAPESTNPDLQELLPMNESSNHSSRTPSLATGSMDSRSSENISVDSPRNPRLSHSTTLVRQGHAQDGHENCGLSDEFNCKTFSDPIPEKLHEEKKVATRLGSFLVYTNVAAFILLLGALSAITFLWFGSDKNDTWRKIMVDGWIGQVVTALSLAIRFAVVTQAGAAVALLASISIESADGVLLKEVPALSIIRYTNTGPIGSVLNFWRIRGRNIRVLHLVGLLTLTTSVLQFTSTILLWDIRSGAVRGFPRQKDIAVGISMDSFFDTFVDPLQQSPNYFTSSPTGYPTFAEWTQSPEPNLPDHISDTGPAIRALLPIASEDARSKILEFNGVASLFDARVVCVRPNITDFSYSTVQHEGDQPGELEAIFHGRISPGSIPKNLASVLWVNGSYYSNGTGNYFQCSMNQMAGQGTGRSFKICVLGDPNPNLGIKNENGYGRLINELDPTQNGSTSKSTWSMSRPGSVMLFFDFQSAGNFYNYPDSFIANGLIPRFNVKERKVWLDFTVEPVPDQDLYRDFGIADAELYRNFQYQISVTSCYSVSYPQPFDTRVGQLQDINITATRETTDIEPSVKWDSNRKTFDTTQPRNQLGVLGPRPSVGSNPQGTLKLNMTSVDKALKDHAAVFSPEKKWTINQVNEGRRHAINGYNYSFMPPSTYSFLNSLIWTTLEFENKQFEIAIQCQECRGRKLRVYIPQKARNISIINLPPILNNTITDIMQDTEDPALALQALLTMVQRAAYYDWLPTFSAKSTITTTSMEPCQLPMFSRGFIIITVNLGIHLILVTGIFFWFLKATRYTLINDVWQVVASLKAKDIDEVLDGVAVADDRNVKRFINASEGLRKRRVRVG
ncbi:uncharacterized protein K452DRAFT_359269 [Aplosporella prunicola CBS 121167]|uniref:Uncharacterized protein n=1 Tax=Aplosporella prunicola CBS 121167 TaxID=1176127 RepID=A0A6A6BC35_9PEZI|nr:uncharacterized protein K452DRAFT_359269 [Aplosporella prunicola CBS 121167]KAF2140814.1 hypothetical protein K452DRAFT_359269 [Aplosporella prunicola CBS 121167]